MALTLFSTGTEYVANSITLTRGTAANITRVGVYHTKDPLKIPAPAEFTTVTLVKPTDPLGDGNNLDVMSLVGPRGDTTGLTAGDWQRWVLVVTAAEDIIRRPDVITIQ